MTRSTITVSLSLVNAFLLVMIASSIVAVSSQLKGDHLASLSADPTPFPTSTSGNNTAPSLPLFAVILVIVLPILCGFSCPALQFILLRHVTESRQVFTTYLNKSSHGATITSRPPSTTITARFSLSYILTGSLFRRDSGSSGQVLRQDEDSAGQPVDIEASSGGDSDKRKNRSLFAELTNSSD